MKLLEIDRGFSRRIARLLIADPSFKRQGNCFYCLRKIKCIAPDGVNHLVCQLEIFSGDICESN